MSGCHQHRAERPKKKTDRYVQWVLEVSGWLEMPALSAAFSVVSRSERRGLFLSQQGKQRSPTGQSATCKVGEASLQFNLRAAQVSRPLGPNVQHA